MKLLTAVGLTVTAVWLALIAYLLWQGYAKWFSMGMNEWGDFLAGAVAPLALFSLVIGYFQHGMELNQQVKEMSTLAENARRQAEAQERRAELDERHFQRQRQVEEREAQPIFVASDGPSSVQPDVGTDRVTCIVNKGGRAFAVSLYRVTPHYMEFGALAVWEEGHTAELTVHHWKTKEESSDVEFMLLYADRFGKRRAQRLRIRHGRRSIILGELDDSFNVT